MLSADRAYNVQRLGFKSLGAYRKGEVYKSIQDRVFTRDGHQCVLCSEPAECVYMELFDYDILSGKTLTYSHAMCDVCNKALHTDKNGNKRGPVKANAAFRAVRCAADRRQAVAELHIWLFKACEAKKKYGRRRSAGRDRPERMATSIQLAMGSSRNLSRRSRSNG